MRTETAEDYIVFCLKQVALTLALAISILALCWSVFPVGRVFNSYFVTGVASFLISACIVVARLLAIEFFSSYFPFSVSYMPVAFGVGTVILAFAFTSVIFVGLAVFFELCMLIVLWVADFKRDLRITSMLALAFALGLVGAWTVALAMLQAIDARGQLFMIELAEKYDFTSNHMCEASKSESILFIDNVADRAIAATFPGTKGLDLKNLSIKKMADYLPRKFHTVRCNPVEETKKQGAWCENYSRFGFCNS